MNEKSKLRQSIRTSIRKARREIPPAYRAAASSRICESFSRLEVFKAAQRIGGFLAFDGEADPLGLMILACEDAKQVYVPVMRGKGQPLSFAPWHPGIAMKPNGFGILEPDVAESDWIGGSELELVITPLVAFDKYLNRIGVGAGYYDRTFGFLKEAEQRTATRLIGFAFEMQKLKKIESNPWDVSLHGVVTEAQVYQS